ncbi:MAG TPA: VWA domain-containing protein [Candidatus Acidoferrum sp.]|nr:VWA domain-containing protein [Candidatus Acidoferrum sp.]
MNRLLLVLPALAALSIAFLIHAQTIPQDELRFGTRPYVPQPENAIRVRTDLVEVPVVIRDSHDTAVKGLTKDDFEIYDQGKKRDISFFAVETASRINAKEIAPSSAPVAATPEPAPPAPAPDRKPRYVAFYFDDFNMSPGDANASRAAAEKFVREGIDPGDKAGIFTTSTTVTQDFTDDKQKLLDALGQIRQHQRKANEGGSSCPNLTPYQAFLIMQNYNVHSDAFDLAIQQAIKCRVCAPPTDKRFAIPCPPFVLEAARNTLAMSEQYSEDTFGIISDVIRYLGKMPGKRMLVLTSSGFMAQTTEPKIFQEKVIDAALQANIVINTLDAKGLWAAPPGGDPSEWQDRITVGPMAAYQDQLDDMQKEINNDPLLAMAEGTGGRFFHNQNDLTRGYRELTTVPEVSYVLGFSPDNINPNGSLHSLKVKLVNPKGLTVSARHGYFAPTKKQADDQAAAYAKRDSLDRAVLSSESFSKVSAAVNDQRVQREGGAASLNLRIHVDVKGLPFVNSGGRNIENLVFVTALFDANGHFQAGQEGLMKLALKDATKDQVMAEGLNAPFSFNIPPGSASYRLRVVIQEQATGRLAALSTPVEIH